MAKVAQLPPRVVPAPVAPVVVAPPDPISIGRNVSFEIDGDTLIIMANIGPDAQKAAVLSKPNAQTGKGGGNPVIATTGGFNYQKGIVPGRDLGISVNIFTKPER